MKILYTLLILVVAIATTVYTQKCDDPKCPDNCDFGVQTEKDTVSQCKKCICSPNPCKTKKCPSEMVCKARKDPKCVGQDCKYKKQAHCVAENKDGDCPKSFNTASIKKPRSCSNDADCPGASKCCNSTCIAPCQTAKCTCLGKSVVQNHINARGCQVCSCSKEATNNPCELQKDPGPCRAIIKNFYYDMESKACKDFKYGGCGGNGNRFDSKEACMKQCNPSQNTTAPEGKAILKVEDNTCSQPKEVGLCRAALPRFYYDSVNKSCVQFNYGGCNGNQNNFETVQACESKCIKKMSNAEICALPNETGRCRGSFPRFYYDSTKKSCQNFTYGGCGGNGNNFQSIEACNSFCAQKQKPPTPVKVDKCSLPMKAGPCKAFNQMFYFDSQTKSCQNFIYGGCEGNENQFKTEEDCKKECGMKVEKVDKCSLPVEAGPCEALMPMFYFNSQTKSCQKFNYGGCQGNENRFKTEEDCKKECGMKVEEDVCKQPKNQGLCYAIIPRFYYDEATKSCQSFEYGGCGGNGNNFETIEDCNARCGKKVDVCAQPMHVGPCRATISRFFFDSKTKQCQQFNYGGCEANENNFETLEACNSRCSKKEEMKKSEVEEKVDSCMQPMHVGPCRAMISRYFFDSKTKQCQQFNFGGCGENENNFETLEACNARCGKKEEIKKVEVEEKIDSCAQPMYVGPCRAMIPRFFFDSKTNQCQQFYFGGCRENENNFETQAACEKKCLKKESKVDNICLLKKEVGKCRGSFTNYYFDSTTKTCQDFLYGGCGGNENRFSTLMECEKKCSN